MRELEYDEMMQSPEAKQILRVNTVTLRRMIERGRLRSLGIGPNNCNLFDPEDVYELDRKGFPERDRQRELASADEMDGTISFDQAVEKYGVSKSTIKRLVRNNEIASILYKNRSYLDAEALESVMKNREATTE